MFERRRGLARYEIFICGPCAVFVLRAAAEGFPETSTVRLVRAFLKGLIAAGILFSVAFFLIGLIGKRGIAHYELFALGLCAVLALRLTLAGFHETSPIRIVRMISSSLLAVGVVFSAIVLIAKAIERRR